jgi:hypothetical protein
MKPIEEFQGNTLTWVQKEALRRAYDLQFDGEAVATLRFQSGCGSLANAEAYGARWTIKREGFLTPRVTVRLLGSDENVAVFCPHFGGGGDVILPGGARYHWKCTNFWRSEWAFLPGPGAPPILQFHRNGFTRMSAQVEVRSASPVTNLLALLGWYLIVVTSEDAAATAVVAVVCAG